MATLIAAVVMPWLRRGEVVRFPWDVVISAAVGIALGDGLHANTGRSPVPDGACTGRARRARTLSAVSEREAAFSAVGICCSGADRSTHSADRARRSSTNCPRTVCSTADGAIDAERYPNFGALARGAYWFRNASTVAYNTSDAVPVILSGRYVASDKAVPTLRHWPVNLFTALARHYHIFASMRFQRLCPPRACEQNAAIPDDTVRLLLSDLGLVWLHIVLPENLTEELPPVVGEWAEFGRAREAPRPGIRRGREGWFARISVVRSTSACTDACHPSRAAAHAVRIRPIGAAV